MAYVIIVAILNAIAFGLMVLSRNLSRKTLKVIHESNEKVNNIHASTLVVLNRVSNYIDNYRDELVHLPVGVNTEGGADEISPVAFTCWCSYPDCPWKAALMFNTLTTQGV